MKEKNLKKVWHYSLKNDALLLNKRQETSDQSSSPNGTTVRSKLVKYTYEYDDENDCQNPEVTGCLPTVITPDITITNSQAPPGFLRKYLNTLKLGNQHLATDLPGGGK